MTFEEYEAISNEYSTKFDLLSYWEEKLDEAKNLACDVELDRLAEKDKENFKKFFEMLWEAWNFAKKHADELLREVMELEEKIATPEFRAMEEAERAA